MLDRYIFSDEAGCFTFNRNANVSQYFIICTVTMSSLDVGRALNDLRHALIWEQKLEIRDYFHATSDQQAVRDRVYETIIKHDFKVQATICEKSKAQPHIRSSKAIFYKYPWYYQFKHAIKPYLLDDMRLLITAASIGSKKERASYTNALNDVMSQTVSKIPWAVDFRPSHCDPCLQVSDYCAWAIQRKWELGDTRSYDLIKDRISYEYDLWRHGTQHFY